MFFLNAKKFCKKTQLKKSLEIYDTWHFNYGVKRKEIFDKAQRTSSNKASQNIVQRFVDLEQQESKSEYKYWFPKNNIFELEKNENMQDINVYIAKQITRGDQNINNTCFSILFNQRQEAYLKRKSNSNHWAIKRGRR